MAKISLNTRDIKSAVSSISAGDEILLSGFIYTARDAAHKRICELLEKGERPPFELDGATVYYAGPTPARPGSVIGSCGPTTSSRMDVFTPYLLERGLSCMIGKGDRSDEVIKSMCDHGAIYLCAVGGAGALAAKCIKSLEVIAFDDLGCESVKKLYVENFPLFCGIDCNGKNIYRTK